ncbi:hypothetical protein A2U01_0069099, partial [Trifolium medium]|nr:hypothetical protein [Trifolium medium]
TICFSPSPTTAVPFAAGHVQSSVAAVPFATIFRRRCPSSGKQLVDLHPFELLLFLFN